MEGVRETAKELAFLGDSIAVAGNAIKHGSVGPAAAMPQNESNGKTRGEKARERGAVLGCGQKNCPVCGPLNAAL